MKIGDRIKATIEGVVEEVQPSGVLAIRRANGQLAHVDPPLVDVEVLLPPEPPPGSIVINRFGHAMVRTRGEGQRWAFADPAHRIGGTEPHYRWDHLVMVMGVGEPVHRGPA